MTRSALDILLGHSAESCLAALPACGPRAPWMTEGDWRDHLLVVAKGHATGNLRALCVDDAMVELQFRLFHAGPVLTPPERLRPQQLRC